MKMSGNYDILSLEYRPFAEGAEKREMPWDSPRETAFTWRGINLDSFDQAWELICQYCKSNITEVAYNTWFSRLKPVSLDFDRATAVIEAPNEFHKQTLLRCYSDLLKEAFDNVFGGGISFQICVHEELKQQQAAPDPFEQDDYELTFDTFVVGPSNRFAHAACQAVAAKPRCCTTRCSSTAAPGWVRPTCSTPWQKNLRRTSRTARSSTPKARTLPTRLSRAIARGTTPAFREKYRKADLFLMDDIQFIAGKNSVQEEFFHTFNTLYEAKKQIVLTSDRPPRDIATLEDRLKTRFEWGLTADVQAPDFETRIAIITRKAESLHLEIPETVCEYIANKLKSNIRQLEGAVKKLRAYHLLENKPINIATAQAAISDIINNSQPTPVTVDKIIEEVARTYGGITPEDIRSQKRNANISKARQVSMYIVREITQMSMVEIGQTFGGRDHSTVVYAVRQVEKDIKKDPHTKAMVDDIIKNIRDR